MIYFYCFDYDALLYCDYVNDYAFSNAGVVYFCYLHETNAVCFESNDSYFGDYDYVFDYAYDFYYDYSYAYYIVHDCDYYVFCDPDLFLYFFLLLYLCPWRISLCYGLV